MKKILYSLFASMSILVAQTYQHDKVLLKPKTFYGFEQTVYVDGSVEGDLQIQALWEKLLSQSSFKSLEAAGNKIYVVYENCKSTTCDYFVGSKVVLNAKESVTKHISKDTYQKVQHTYQQKSDLTKAYKTIFKEIKDHNNKRIIEIHPFDKLAYPSYIMDIYLSVRK